MDGSDSSIRLFEHPESFGAHICTRRHTLPQRLVFLPLLAILLGADLSLLSGTFSRVHAGMRPGDWLDWCIRLLACLALLAAVLKGAHGSLRVIAFYEQGVVDRCLWWRRAHRYSDAVSEKHRTERSYVKGIYVSTSLVMKVEFRDGSTLRFRASYNEKPIGLARTVLSSRFEAHDEMDLVCSLIRAHIDGRMGVVGSDSTTS